ncbi:endonuclease/exonuclease/phosphatase family protein [Candidatus Peregrinibacteria bacterium]|nr:endonuclease/exonuclease/phosphatase family protein [Candidatus Peregrinibacteria bacterium]
METQPFRILLYNIGYCTELDGSFTDYFLHFYRYFYTPRRILREVARGLNSLVDRVQPDLCCFAEIHRGRRSAPRLHSLTFHAIDNKYGRKSWLRHLPFFRNNCNGIFSQRPVSYRKSYFKNGTKKLMYEVKLENGTCLLFAHFSLRAATRRKQFVELKEIVAKHDDVILCGDFNTLSHPEELQKFARGSGLKIINPQSEATYPAIHPTKDIDLFLCSKHIHLRALHVLHEVKLSDHLPVLLEMEL